MADQPLPKPILYVESPGNLDALRCLICAHEASADVAVVLTSQARHPEPFELPCLLLSPSNRITGAKAVCGHFLPSTEASVDDWLTKTSERLGAAAAPWLRSLAACTTGVDAADVEASKVAVTAFFEEAATAVTTGHLVGGTLSVADAALWAYLFPFFGAAGELVTLPGLCDSVDGALVAWHKALSARPAFQRALKEVDPAAVSKLSPSLADAPVLPVPGQRNVLITSALPYVNNVPHLGNIIGCVLSADVHARFLRARGTNCIFICGTDEYGTATETKALQEGLTPAEICTKYNAIHAEIYDWFQCSFDRFGRTSTPQQTEITQSIFWDLHKNGFTLTDTMEQLFCDACQKFLADRFVEGTCPHCKYTDARGDQCDACGKLLNAPELIDPKCKICSAKPEIRTTEHIFLDLPKGKPELEAWVDKASVAGDWDANATGIAKAWTKDKLQPRCITRDLKWGTPVPLEGFTHKVFYVWFDAPIGYISITALYTPEWKRWWQNPDQVELYQFMGKDNVAFHTIIFPSSLIGSGKPWTMLKKISSTEYLNYESKQFSKSRNTGVFGDDAKSTGIPPEVWRFYLIANRPEGQDCDFTWEQFVARNNTELLNNLGNFIHRSLHFCHSTFGAAIPPITPTPEDQETVAKVDALLQELIALFESVQIRATVPKILQISALGNEYFQKNEPWKLKKSDLARCGSVIGLAVNIVHLLAACVSPIMPTVTHKICGILRVETPRIPSTFSLALPCGHAIGPSTPLFEKITEDKVEEFRDRFAGGVKEPLPLDVRVGAITSARPHAAADRLYCLEVDVGAAAPRRIVSGLKGHYTVEQLVGRQVLVLCNLPEADFKGEPSQGMVLCAVKGRKTALLECSGAAVGAPLCALGTDTVPNTELDIKAFGKLDLKLKAKAGAVVGVFKHHVLAVGETPVTADPAKGLAEGAQIK